MTIQTIQSATPTAARLPTTSQASLGTRLIRLRGQFFANIQQRYLVLANAVCLAREVDADPTMLAELEKDCEIKGLRFHAETSTLNRVLRYITEHQGRANNLAAALRDVPAVCKEPDEIVEFINTSGGLEKLRLKNNADSTSAKKSEEDLPSQDDDHAIDALVRTGLTASTGQVTVKGCASRSAAAAVETVTTNISNSEKPADESRPRPPAEPASPDLVPESDADGRAQAIKPSPYNDSGFKTIRRSDVTANSLPTDAFFMMAAAKANLLLVVDDDAQIVKDTMEFVRERLKAREAGGISRNKTSA